MAMYRSYKRRRIYGPRRRFGRSIYLRRRRVYRRGGSRAYQRNLRRPSKIKRVFANFNLQGNAAYAPYLPTSNLYGVNVYRLSDVGANKATALTNLTNMFSEYRLKWVKLQFKLRQSVDSSGVTGVRPRLYWSRTWNGVTSNLLPSSLGDIMENGDFQTRVLDAERPVTIFIRPRASNPVYQTGATWAYNTKDSGWIHTDYPAVEHYGLQFAVDSFTDTANYIDVLTTYGLEFKGYK